MGEKGSCLVGSLVLYLTVGHNLGPLLDTMIPVNNSAFAGDIEYHKPGKWVGTLQYPTQIKVLECIYDDPSF